MEKKKIDDVFREGLAHPEASFDETHWDAMERKLYRGRRKKIIRLIGFVSVSVAAAILLFFLMFKPSGKTDTSVVRITNKTGEPQGKKKAVKVMSETNKERDNQEKVILTKQSEVKTGKIQVAKQSNHRSLTEIRGFLYRDTVVLNPSANITLSSNSLSLKSVRLEGPKHAISDLSFDGQPKKDRSIGSLTILAAPDLTAVRGAGNPSFSQNVGLLYTQPISAKISLSAGLLYARKHYNSPYSFYRPNVRLEWSERPIEVDAACDVLDVPLLINYGVYNKSKMRIQVSAGVSSYFMLRERYQFSYSSGSSYNSNLPAAYEVRGKNNHLFGVADFSVSVDQKINENMRIGIRPFVKVPLTGIGYGQTKLESKGIALMLDFNIGGKK